MENIFCADLNLDFAINTNALETFKDTYGSSKILTLSFPKDQLDSRVVSWLKSLGLCFSDVIEVFCTPPGGKLDIHIDAAQLGTNRCKINWVFGAVGSKMIWWDLKDNSRPMHVLSASWNQAPYVLFDQSECTEIWSADIKQPTLVNSGIPHSITNDTIEARWSLSFELADIATGNPIDWYSAVTRLKNFII